MQTHSLWEQLKWNLMLSLCVSFSEASQRGKNDVFCGFGMKRQVEKNPGLASSSPSSPTTQWVLWEWEKLLIEHFLFLITAGKRKLILVLKRDDFSRTRWARSPSVCWFTQLRPKSLQSDVSNVKATSVPGFTPAAAPSLKPRSTAPVQSPQGPEDNWLFSLIG